MGNPTIVYFIKESLLANKPVKEESSMSFLTWATARLNEEKIDQQQGKPLWYFDIIEEMVNCPPIWKVDDNSDIEKLGIQMVSGFENTGVWSDVTKLYSKLPESLQQRFKSDTEFRFPVNMESPIRALIKEVDNISAMRLFEYHEMDNVITACQDIIENLNFDREWRLLIHAHKVKTYDLALFHSLV